MTSSPVNIFQRLMRKWETVHPYNAAQLLEVVGDFDSLATFDNWSQAWSKALAATGLGDLESTDDCYRFLPCMECRAVQRVVGSWQAHISEQLDRPFELGDAFPFRPFLGPAGNGTFVVGIVYRHWIADSVSIRMLLREWFMAAVDPSNGRTLPLRLPCCGYWNTVGPGRRDPGIGESIAHSIRRQTRLRRAKKIGSQNLNDPRTQFRHVGVMRNVLPGLKQFARHRQVRVNDIFLAALAEACNRHVPLQSRPSRREVAVGSIIDLRPASTVDLSDVFGLFLGFMNVVCQPQELADFDRLVEVVSKQVRNQKSHGIAACSLMWMTAAATLGRWSKPGELYHFYRKDLPLAGWVVERGFVAHLGRRLLAEPAGELHPREPDRADDAAGANHNVARRPARHRTHPPCGTNRSAARGLDRFDTHPAA